MEQRIGSREKANNTTRMGSAELLAMSQKTIQFYRKCYQTSNKAKVGKQIETCPIGAERWRLVAVR